MNNHFKNIEIETHGKQLIELTEIILAYLKKSNVKNGLLNLSILHTSASLVVQENASPSVTHDLNRFFDKLVPESTSEYLHNEEGPDDMPSHIRSALTNSNLTLSIIDTKLALGTWQGIFLFEHRISKKRRNILIHIFGA